jgi:hypothetical protein
VDSALGLHRDPEMTLDLSSSGRFVAYGAGHLDLLDRPDVYAQVRDWLGR